MASGVTALPLTHCATEQGRILLPVSVTVSAGLPTEAEVTDSVGAPGAARGACVVIVKGKLLEVPGEALAAGLETETVAVPENAVSLAGIWAVSCVALTYVVGRGEPFQFTVEAPTATPFTVELFTKFVPFTVSVIPVALQKGVEACEEVDAESDVTAGAGPGGAAIVKKTTLEISVVFVLYTFDVGEAAEPGICTATCTVPAVVRSEAGTGAVNSTELTSVVVSCVCVAPTFQIMMAPVTKPAPLTVIVKPDPPADTVLGLRNATEEEEVWIVRLVLYSEHADTKPHTANAAMSQIFRRGPSRAHSLLMRAPSRARTRREYIRTRSSRATRPHARQMKTFWKQPGC